MGHSTDSWCSTGIHELESFGVECMDILMSQGMLHVVVFSPWSSFYSLNLSKHNYSCLPDFQSSIIPNFLQQWLAELGHCAVLQIPTVNDL